jgi:preprotein translocase subunit SecE
MSANASKSMNVADMAKWVVSIALLVGTIAGNTYFDEVSLLYRAVAIVITVAIALLVAAKTEKGRNALDFARESRTEIRKVVWPSRQETRTTTLIVLGATVIVGIFLYLLDLIIIEAVSFVTGLGV